MVFYFRYKVSKDASSPGCVRSEGAMLRFLPNGLNEESESAQGREDLWYNAECGCVRGGWGVFLLPPIAHVESLIKAACCFSAHGLRSISAAMWFSHPHLKCWATPYKQEDKSFFKPNGHANIYFFPDFSMSCLFSPLSPNWCKIKSFTSLQGNLGGRGVFTQPASAIKLLARRH